MWSYITSFFGYFIQKEDDENDNFKEDFLAEQIMDLEAKEGTFESDPGAATHSSSTHLPRNAICYQKTGVIKYICDNHVLIDGVLYFETVSCSISLHLNDKVLYLYYLDANDVVNVVRILENQGSFWGDDENASDESSFKVIEHVIIGEVDHRLNRNVFMKDTDLKFNLDVVEAGFVPVQGDWLELRCSVKYDEGKPSDISADQVLQVIAFRPLRRKVQTAVITEWSGDSGTCDRLIYINRQSLQNELEPQVGAKVMVEAIESNQGTCTWRVIKLISFERNIIDTEEHLIDKSSKDNVTLDIEEKMNIKFTHPVTFENVDYQGSAKMTLSITNNSNQVYVINKWIMLSKKRDSQVDIKPFLKQPIQIYPDKTFLLTVTCHPKFLGKSKECLIILFRGFQLKRFIEINVVNSIVDTVLSNNNSTKNDYISEHEKNNMMNKIRRNGNNQCVAGIRPVKPPAFIPVKLGFFPIPDKIWSAVLGDSEESYYTADFNKIIERIETHIPCISQDLNMYNYIDRWHALLFMEEIQANINMRIYDTQKAFLIRCQEYLGLEIKGLSERRPSLVKGDRVLAKDIWDTNSIQFEGFIHQVNGELILMKFSPFFHETYNGSDVSLEFHFSRSIYRRSHQAITLAISNLGQDILFPSKFIQKPSQVSKEKLENISWFNDCLNKWQKRAVTNILKGESRPLPYCIFGPPGTGKTITVIETILQILSLLPDSRILVATPSNSAANLIVERLLQYRKSFSDSMIRLIANYLVDSDTIPDNIKPFCATVDISREGTSKPKNEVRDGINLNCQTSFVGRHRVTVGTCCCLGCLAQMGLPKGHFTHVIIDEAGQATEPEIMIPLTFIDKNNGHIVLAGDPMQLGPVIISKYCKEFGMGESFLSRLLETFPYQRDYDAFEDGYNNTLITKLNDNYRSLEEVLRLPSEMFYGGSLEPKIDRAQSWIKHIINAISVIFSLPETKTGGIYVYGIRGCNIRGEDSPSWYNPQEAATVAMTTCKLYKKNISIHDIGIITPYIAQIKYLRVLFDAIGLPQPKIGTVEEFQGQERPVILISTVRSTETLLEHDAKHTLGFVKNAKRLNVAITRGQVAVILFCNPHLLCTDQLWNKVITYAVGQEKYIGCDLPIRLACNENI